MARNENIYYIFPDYILGAFLIPLSDMTLNEGRGAVTDKNIPIDAAWMPLTGWQFVKKDNTENVWVITRKFTEDAMAAFLVDETD